MHGAFDTHTHLNSDELFADATTYIEQARELGAPFMNVVGYDTLGNQRALDLAQRYDGVYASVGFQPEDVANFDQTTLNQLAQQAKQPGVIALGEMGLDYYWDSVPRAQQKAAFEAQLALAQSLDLPVIIHNREAFDDVLSILSRYQLRDVIMHSFAGNVAEVEAFVAAGYYISFSGMVTFKKSEILRQAAQKVPHDRLLVETDAPYLTPVPYRGKQNEPGYVVHTIAHLAQTLGQSPETLTTQTTLNARRVFGV